MRGIILGLLASLVVSSTAASETEYAKGSGWTVYRNDDDCDMFLFYGETILFVTYTYGTNKSFLAVLDPAFKSIKETQRYPVEITFLKGKTVDDGWGTQDMVGLRVEGVPGIGVVMDGRTLLADLKGSNTLLMTRDDGDVLIESLSLTGSAIPVAKLEACSQAVHRTNPADPFKGTKEVPPPVQRDPFARPI